LENRPLSFWEFLRVLLWPTVRSALPALAALLGTLVTAAAVGYVLTVAGVSKDLQTWILIPLVLIGVLIVVWLTYRSSVAGSLDSQLIALASTLQAASAQASAIEAGIQTRQRAVETLQARSQEYNQLVEVNREAADAIAKVVERAVGQRERRSLLLNTVVGFVIGLITGLAADPIRAWITALAHR
jgi:hypothetical protein